MQYKQKPWLLLNALYLKNHPHKAQEKKTNQSTMTGAILQHTEHLSMSPSYITMCYIHNDLDVFTHDCAYEVIA